jgi:hypothetical protein
MTEEQIKLARRAVACRGWDPLGGMLCADGAWRARVGDGWNWRAGAEVLPVLDDPATLGCLLALVREAWDDEGAYAMQRSVCEGGGWALWACPPGDVNIPRGTGATEAEALVAALEGAP